MSKCSERWWTLSVTALTSVRGVNDLRRLGRGGGCISLGIDFGVRRTARHSVWRRRPMNIFFLVTGRRLTGLVAGLV